MPVPTFTTRAIGLDGLARQFSRADIEFHGVDHAGASYEGRVFLDNPTADKPMVSPFNSPKTPEPTLTRTAPRPNRLSCTRPLSTSQPSVRN